MYSGISVSILLTTGTNWNQICIVLLSFWIKISLKIVWDRNLSKKKLCIESLQIEAYDFQLQMITHYNYKWFSIQKHSRGFDFLTQFNFYNIQ